MSYTLATLNTRVRNILHQYTQSTFQDVNIYQYLNEGYVDFCVRSEYLRKETSVTLTADTAIQTLPTDAITIYRAEWDDVKVAMSDTHTMDVTYGDGWRTTTGEIVENILQDNEDAGKFRIYPILDTTAIGSTKLKLIHSYIPAEIVTPWTTALSIPIIYQVNLADYAIYRCLYEEVQSDRNIPLADRHYDIYMGAIARCRSESFKSKLFNVESRVKHRRFV